MKNKILGGILMIPLCFIFSYIFASLFSENTVVYFSFASRQTEFYVFFFILLALSCAADAALIFTSLSKKIVSFFNIFEKNSKPDALGLILLAVITVLYFLLAFDGPVVDYQTHTELALEFDWSKLAESFAELSHPLWHIVTNLLVKVFYFPSNYACAISTALFCSLTFFITRSILIHYVSEPKYDFVCDITAALLMFMQPVYIKAFNPNQIIGQGSPFMLHNPTSLAVQPFSLICTFLFLRIYKNHVSSDDSTLLKDCLRLSLFSYLSSLAKPSFLQVFIPATFIFLAAWLLLSRFKDFIFCLKIAVVFLPALANIVRVMLIEFFFPTSEESGGIAFGFFEVWSVQSPFIPVSIMLAGGFCLLYIVLKNIRINHKLEIGIILLCWLVGILEFGLIMETGDRKYHGNFSWGYCISLSLMYVFVTAELLTNILKKKFSVKNIRVPEALTLTVFTVQFIQGAAYFFSII